MMIEASVSGCLPPDSTEKQKFLEITMQESNNNNKISVEIDEELGEDNKKRKEEFSRGAEEVVLKLLNYFTFSFLKIIK